MDEQQRASDVQKAALEDLRAIWIRLMADAQKARRNLLLSSSIGTLIAITGATPQKIETVGIELHGSPEILFYIFILLIIAYFLWSFLHYNERDLNLHTKSRTGEQIEEMLGEYYSVYRNYVYFYGRGRDFKPFWFYLPCTVTAVAICAICIRIVLLMIAAD